MNNNIKEIAVCLVFIFVFSFSALELSGQEESNHISAGINISHFFGIEDGEQDHHGGFYSNTFYSPGFEILYFRKLVNHFWIGTGVNITKGAVASSSKVTFYEFRFHSVQNSIPLLFRIDLNWRKIPFHITSGIYIGEMYRVNILSPGSGSWTVVIEEEERYKGHDYLFNDFIFEMGYVLRRIEPGSVYIGPFLKYRYNTTWLNKYENRLYTGVKVNYTLNF